MFSVLTRFRYEAKWKTRKRAIDSVTTDRLEGKKKENEEKCVSCRGDWEPSQLSEEKKQQVYLGIDGKKK